ncbi:uncharacterized protein N7482_000844 [Penicillium canariense]|uniref:Uncharacterized protein n=1 Tax=Penicillium canariense TaxID=189055 RepID=A0A9W9IEJ3_9EURO|nr:uncharacterized protein N7482_000844 [Penicillium canariense]KAJ5174967.1 hypothetical protein N7482_000844 [Penicillium canariense]
MAPPSPATPTGGLSLGIHSAGTGPNWYINVVDWVLLDEVAGSQERPHPVCTVSTPSPSRIPSAMACEVGACGVDPALS